MREFSIEERHIRHYNITNSWRWILSHIKRRIPFCIISLSALVIFNISNTYIPLITGHIFDQIAKQSIADNTLLLLSLTVAFVIVVAGGMNITYRFTSELLGKLIERDIRDEVYYSLLGKSLAFHHRQLTGEIMARTTDDIRLVSQMLAPGAMLMVDACVALLLPIIFIAYLHWQLLLFPSIFLLVFLLILYRYSLKLWPWSLKEREQFGHMNTYTTESLVNVELIKSTARETEVSKQFEGKSSEYRDIFLRRSMFQAGFLPPLMMVFFLAAAFLHGILLVSWHELSVGELVSYVGIMTLLRSPISVAPLLFSLISSGFAGSQRVLEIVQAQNTIGENKDGYQADMEGELIFDHVSFGYKDNRLALKDLSFTIKSNQITVIIGQTGSGKTTLTQLINRLYDATGGRIFVDGVAIQHWNLASLRSQIAIIEQDTFLLSRSIAENISYGARGNVNFVQVEAAAKQAQAHEFIINLKYGYQTILGEKGITLSGGQRQRIAIARALITNPRILIIDDAMSSIDSKTEHEIQKAIQQALQGRTAIIVTNRLSQIRLADQILILRRGELLDKGTHKELMRRCDYYRRVFNN